MTEKMDLHPALARYLGIAEITRPKHPTFRSLARRLETFATYPKDQTPSAEKLAQAGFRYMGVSDRMSCFHCGGGVMNWMTYEEPWEEHARWYPNCGFVLQSKGAMFVEHFSTLRLAKTVSFYFIDTATIHSLFFFYLFLFFFSPRK